jgi:putative membrane protein
MRSIELPRRPFVSPGIRAALLFTFAYLAAAICFALAHGNQEFLFYIAVMLVLMTAIGWVHHRVCFSGSLIWGLALWGLLHMMGGLVPIPDSWPRESEACVLYNLWLTPLGPKYDQLIHAYGFGLMTWVCWQGLQAALAPHGTRPTIGLLVLCTAASTGFGALNEVIEFAATQLFAKTNVGGYENTGWDLFSNLVGATIGAGAIRWGNR